MIVYWKQLGSHIHCRVFVNGAKSGDLVVTEDEWADFMSNFTLAVHFCRDPD